MRRGLGAAIIAVALGGLTAGCQLVPVDALPIAPGTRECFGIPPVKCDELVDTAGLRRPGRVAGFRVRCTADVCTQGSGSAEVGVLWDDGVTETQGAFWVGEP